MPLLLILLVLVVYISICQMSVKVKSLLEVAFLALSDCWRCFGTGINQLTLVSCYFVVVVAVFSCL